MTRDEFKADLSDVDYRAAVVKTGEKFNVPEGKIFGSLTISNIDFGLNLYIPNSDNSALIENLSDRDGRYSINHNCFYKYLLYKADSGKYVLLFNVSVTPVTTLEDAQIKLDFELAKGFTRLSTALEAIRNDIINVALDSVIYNEYYADTAAEIDEKFEEDDIFEDF